MPQTTNISTWLKQGTGYHWRWKIGIHWMPTLVSELYPLLTPTEWKHRRVGSSRAWAVLICNQTLSLSSPSSPSMPPDSVNGSWDKAPILSMRALLVLFQASALRRGILGKPGDGSGKRGGAQRKRKREQDFVAAPNPNSQGACCNATP